MNRPGRIQEDLRRNIVEESLNALPHGFEMNHPEIDVACRVRIASNDCSGSNDSHRFEGVQDERDCFAQRPVVFCRKLRKVTLFKHVFSWRMLARTLLVTQSGLSANGPCGSNSGPSDDVSSRRDDTASGESAAKRIIET